LLTVDSGKRLAEAKLAAGVDNAAPVKEPKSQGRQNLQIPSPPDSGAYDSPAPELIDDAAIKHHDTTFDRFKAPLESLAFLSALFENGTILGVACGANFPSKSRPVAPEIPASLQPTILQLSTVHWQWIDRFPFPECRDEMIIQSGNIDEEDFLGDLINMETFRVTLGARSWDPTAFTICPTFQAKWGFLFPSFSTTPTFPYLVDPNL